jgi:hypothetical protein
MRVSYNGSTEVSKTSGVGSIPATFAKYIIEVEKVLYTLMVVGEFTNLLHN